MRSRRRRIVRSRPPRGALSESSPMAQDQRRYEFGILNCAVTCVAVADAFVGTIVFDVRPDGRHRDSPLPVLTPALAPCIKRRLQN